MKIIYRVPSHLSNHHYPPTYLPIPHPNNSPQPPKPNYTPHPPPPSLPSHSTNQLPHTINSTTNPMNPQSWTHSQNPNILISTNQSLIQPAAVNKAFGSAWMYWTKPLAEDVIQRMLKGSLCFGVFEKKDGGGEMEQLGLARLITDKTTFAYITDIYILPTHQSQGLGKYLLRCIQEVLDSWPDLRGTLLYADEEGDRMRFYERGLGMRSWVQGSDGLVVMTRRFGGSGMEVDVRG
ncbi:hypothetical protein HYFRA_00007633 [Hymenoscyphus fraxineus]|uniref:N-acetyltransferase domain-containing protein n=1 Tax=Hymenoscyphus fraxineus TaxID=746836 RepID=A0A9N9KS61_9HELO|nr:hypothetical protein HYFRA_00007633 [Hymenoscyphus fraxineus]